MEKEKLIRIKITGTTKSRVTWWRYLQGVVIEGREESLSNGGKAFFASEISIKLLNDTLPFKETLGLINNAFYKKTTLPLSTAADIITKIPKKEIKKSPTSAEIFDRMHAEREGKYKEIKHVEEVSTKITKTYKRINKLQKNKEK